MTACARSSRFSRPSNHGQIERCRRSNSSNSVPGELRSSGPASNTLHMAQKTGGGGSTVVEIFLGDRTFWPRTGEDRHAETWKSGT